jgi:chaperonin GroES
MVIKPIGERVLIKPVEVEAKTKGGIVLPDTVSKEQPNIGEVVAVGSGEKVAGISAGNKVIYAKYAGTEIKKDGEKFIILNADDVLAVVEQM